MFHSRSASARPVESRTAEVTIALDDVRVGMFIHLDGGWLSHPFARSSFRVANAQQLATLRGLKLAHVRWSPELSDPALPAGGSLLPGATEGSVHDAAAAEGVDVGAGRSVDAQATGVAAMAHAGVEGPDRDHAADVDRPTAHADLAGVANDGRAQAEATRDAARAPAVTAASAADGM